ncbi:MAG: redoxin family protein [Chryseolinea sp.]
MRVFFNAIIPLIILSKCAYNSDDGIHREIPVRTVVAGRILNPQPENKTITLAINRVSFGQESHEIPVDSTGIFQFNFESYIATDAWLSHNTNFRLIIHPGDSIYVQLDGSKDKRPDLLESIKITGDNYNTNRQIAVFQKDYFASKFFLDSKSKGEAIKEFEADEFRRYADKLKYSRTNFFEAFKRDHNLNSEAEKWVRSFMSADYYYDMTNYPEEHRKSLVLRQSEWEVPLSYYNYLKTYEPIRESLPNGSAIFGLGDKWLHRYIRLRVDEQLKAFAFEPTGDQMDSLFFETIKQNTPDSLLKEILITQYFNDRLEEGNLESFAKSFEKIKSSVKSGFLREPLFDNYVNMAGAIQESSYSANVSAAKNQSESNGLIDDILNKHKGKPVYIDVWATWCAPCLEEFAYSQKLKKELDDIEFVYLCIESDSSGFGNTIKRFQLEGDHYFLNAEESNQLRKEFEIDGIPNYLLADGKGGILYNGSTLRPSADKTKEEIVKLLGKGE